MADPLWFKVTAELPRHSKSMLLGHLLDDKRAWSYVVQMWGWFVEHQGSGEISGPHATVMVARGAGWEGDPDLFCQHLVACGFLDRTDGGLAVHDWAQWAGFHVVSRAKATRKKRGQRSQAECPEAVPVAVPVLSPGQDRGRPRDCPSENDESDAIEGGHLSPLVSPVVVSSSSLSTGGLPTREERRDSSYPLTARLISTLAGLGVAVGHPTKNADSAAVEANCARDGVETIASRVAAAYRLRPKSTLGWFLDDMAAPKTRSKPRDERAPAAPSTDWNDKRAPWEIPS